MLEFNEKFFDKEEREGFVVDETMKRYWANHMELLRAVGEICRANDIRWYVDWGTLLGTVRHNGWIPWDDDMDICMRRPDYEKFFKIINEDKSYGFEPHIWSLREEHDEFWGAVSNGARIVGDKAWRDGHYGSPFIATIDVHPLDVLPRDPEEAKTVKTLIGMLWKTRNIILSRRPKEEWWEQLQLFEKILDIKFDEDISLPNQLIALANTLGASYGEEDGDYYVMWLDYVRNNERKLPKEWFDETAWLQFEQMKVPAPKKYHEVLSRYYGDYLVRKPFASTHEYPSYNKQIELLKQTIQDIDKESIPLE